MPARSGLRATIFDLHGKISNTSRDNFAFNQNAVRSGHHETDVSGQVRQARDTWKSKERNLPSPGNTAEEFVGIAPPQEPACLTSKIGSLAMETATAPGHHDRGRLGVPDNERAAQRAVHPPSRVELVRSLHRRTVVLLTTNCSRKSKPQDGTVTKRKKRATYIALCCVHAHSVNYEGKMFLTTIRMCV